MTITYTGGGGPLILTHLDQVTDLFLANRDDEAAASALYTRESFIERTTRQAARPGFACVLATDTDARLIGFAFGFTFAAGNWWAGNPQLPPDEILREPKFAVIELNVAADHRGHGIGRRLMDELLDGRSEPYAVLTSIPDTPARATYDRWGWQQIGTAQHSPDAPVMDQLVLPLH
jgi:GNAT superfamily N-acetyltransferase